MPKIYLDTINATTSLAIWHITESEGFFLQKVPLKTNISHPHKRLQHLAGRYLLQEIAPDFPIDLIRIADTRKPYVPGESHHFSISHCGNYAAAIVSTTHRVGIDIEIYTEKVLKILHKFLSNEEWSLVNRQFLIEDRSINAESTGNSQSETGNWHLATLLWSVKEAVYKWFGNGEMGFIQHMQITKIAGGNEGEIEMDFSRDVTLAKLLINYKLLDLFSLAWILTEI